LKILARSVSAHGSFLSGLRRQPDARIEALCAAGARRA